MGSDNIIYLSVQLFICGHLQLRQVFYEKAFSKVATGVVFFFCHLLDTVVHLNQIWDPTMNMFVYDCNDV